MALFKILKGQQARLPNTSKQGYAYYTTDKGKFYIFNSETERRTLNPDIKITIGNQTKTSTTLSPEVAFDLASIGAAAAGHNHDNRYLKLSGGTMTGDIIFTNKDANRLIWTDEDKKVSTTGHYATSDRVAINSASYPGYNLLVNGTTLFQGETVTRIVRPEETKKYSLGTDDYKWSALYVSGNAQIDGSIKNLAVNGGIYWNPHVESTGDASDAASIEVITAGVAGGTQLRIQQQNEANDVVNIVTNATTGFKHNGHTVWDDTNDGPGSGADADLLDGCHGSYQPSANTYVRREGNGYTKQNYILYTPNKGQNPSIGSFVVTNTGDNYLRFATKTNVVNQLAESPGTLINNNGHTYSITVTGDANTYYPVVIDTPLEKEAINYVSIWKNLGSKTATYTGNHSNGTSSMWLIYELRSQYWDGNGGYLKCWYYSMPYANLCANTISAGNSAGKLVVYLRGGGTSYNISTTYKSSVSVYYQQTNLGDSSYPVRVSPTTSISNRGKCSTTFLGYGDVVGNLVGNADSATIPLGFASRSTNPTWGNTIGTTITCWNDSTGGGIDFRRDNPSSGKMSVKVDGRFYGNEGVNPASLMTNANGYWGIGDPDGNSSNWIRTTTNGLIPVQSGGQGNGHSALGTSSWYFKEAFIDNINGTNLYLRGQTANRLVWLNSSKMLDTTGHYASGSKVAINSTSEPGYNFYVNGTSYFVNNVNIAGANTNYKLYVNGSSLFNGNTYITNQGALIIYGGTVGSDASTLVSKTAGVLSYGDTGPKIDFGTSATGDQRGAIIFTDHDAAGAGVSWHFVSNQADWNVNSKRFVAKTSITIGQNLPNTNYNLYVNGSTYLNGILNVASTLQPTSTNTQTLGTSSLRWAKVYIGTADTYGSTTKGVYWNAGVPTAMTYELKSTVNNGTATRIAYYSGTNAVSSGSIVTDGSYLRNIGGYNNSSYSLSAESAIINNYLNIAGISSSPTRYKLYVVGQSWIKGTLWTQHLYPEANQSYNLGSNDYKWNGIHANQLWLYNLQEGKSDVTNNTEILTSYASDNGFADSNANGKIYRRDAIHLYNYIIGKADGRYVKKTGDTMTGNLSFSSIGDVATSAKISWNGSTDGADIYYQTTGADQGNLVLNTRDDANCYIRFAYNGAFKSYIRTSDGTYIGKLLGISEGSTWIDGQRYERSGFNLSNATTTTDYWPWLRQTNTSSARWFSFGTLGNCFYMIGSSTGRTDNGYDHGLCYDISNGNLSGINDIYGNAQHLLINGVTWSSNWNWSGQGGQPSWLWGSNDGSSMYVWNPSNFSVYRAKELYNTDRGTNQIYCGPNDAADGAGGRLNNLVISSWWGVSFTTSCAATYQNTTAVGIDCRNGHISAGGSLWISQHGDTGGGIHLADDGGFYDFNNGFGTAAFSSGLIVARGKDQNNTAINLSSDGRGWAYSSSEAQFAVKCDSAGDLYLYANGTYRGIYSTNVGPVIMLHNDNTVHMSANTYNNRSDIRLKQNIFNLKQKQSVNFIRQLQPVKFQFKHTDKYCFGFIAQDVLKVMKNFNLKEKDYNLVTKPEFDPNHPENERYYNISYTELIAPTIKAVQYLDKQIEQNKQKEKELQQQILKLKSQIQLLNAKLDTLVVSHL